RPSATPAGARRGRPSPCRAAERRGRGRSTAAPTAPRPAPPIRPAPPPAGRAPGSSPASAARPGRAACASCGRSALRSWSGRACLLLVMLRHEGVEQAHAEAAAALGHRRLVLAVPGDPRDVEVRPGRAVLDEALQELRGGDRAAGAPAADVLHVGDVAVDRLAVVR